MVRTQAFTLVAAALSMCLAMPLTARAQPPQPPADQQGKTDAAPQDQAAKTDEQAAKPPQPVATTDPNLQVATVRLEGGYRASKVIGAAVYNVQNQQIGTVDDIIMNHQNQADLVVLSVGGFLGVGGKLVALPYAKIQRTDNGKVLLENASKDQLANMPGFAYAQ